MEWLEITAESVKSAKDQALVHLGVHESDAEFEVLSEGRVGLFGRVKQQARVRARVIPTPVRPKESRSRGTSSRRSGSSRRSNATSTESQPSARSGRQAPSSRMPEETSSTDDGSRNVVGARSQRASDHKKDMEPMMDHHDTGPSLLEQADLAESFVQGIAETLGVGLTFTRHDVEDGIMRIEANGEGIGLLVGRRGATAQAIDELVRTVLQRSGGSTREGKIRMDVGGVRARRAAALAEFTRRVADQAIESGEEIALEPMNRMERKIIHDVVTGIDQVESRSEGEDPHRRVIIAASSE